MTTRGSGGTGEPGPRGLQREWGRTWGGLSGHLLISLPTLGKSLTHKCWPSWSSLPEKLRPAQGRGEGHTPGGQPPWLSSIPLAICHQVLGSSSDSLQSPHLAGPSTWRRSLSLPDGPGRKISSSRAGTLGEAGTGQRLAPMVSQDRVSFHSPSSRGGRTRLLGSQVNGEGAQEAFSRCVQGLPAQHRPRTWQGHGP